jgi:hypothetical protein
VKKAKILFCLENGLNSYDSGNGVPERNYWPRQRNVGVYLGYKLSSKPGLAFNGLAVAAVGVVFAIFLATFSGFD